MRTMNRRHRSGAPVSAADFQMAADGTSYLFQAFLGGTGGTLVASFTDPDVAYPTPALFYGFSNITFDTIKISLTAPAADETYWLIGNIQSDPVPEPTSLLLLGTGLAGIGLAAWRRKK